MPRRLTPITDAAIAVLYAVAPPREAVRAEAELREWWSARGPEYRVAEVVVDAPGDQPLHQREGFLQAIAALTAHGAGALLVRRREDLGTPGEAALAVALARSQSAAVVVAATAPEDPPAWLQEPVTLTHAELVGLLEAHEAVAHGTRIRIGVRQRRARGAAPGGAVPYGYRRGTEGGLEEHPEEQAAIAMMLELHRAGRSYREIARELAAAGHAPRPSGRGRGTGSGPRSWHPQSVRNVVQRALRQRTGDDE